MKRTNKRLILCVTLLICLLAFIWGNSLLPGDESGDLSGFVGKILGTLLPFLDLTTGIGSFILRKFAHFSEFAALGLVLCWFFGMTQRRKWLAHLLPLGCGIIVAGIDETIQIFSPGRHASIVDVGIDSAGALTGIVFLLIITILCRNWNKKSRMHYDS